MEIRSRLYRALAIVGLLLALVLTVRAGLLDPVNLKEIILSFGPLAPLAFVLLYAVAVFLPYATTVMTMAAGLAFGAFWGTVLTFSVTIFASLLPFTVSRRLGRARVEEWIGNTRVRKYADLINRNAFLVFFYLRLIPSLPYELQNHIAGVTRISYRQFMLASVLGVGPITFILAFLGDSLTDPGSGKFWLAAGIYLFAILAPAAYTAIMRRRGKTPFFEGI